MTKHPDQLEGEANIVSACRWDRGMATERLSAEGESSPQGKVRSGETQKLPESCL